MNKFHARKVTIDGITFASKAEGDRYGMLKLFERARQIRALACQPEYPLKVNGILIGFYTGDFCYFESGRQVCEDVKGGPIREADSLRMRVFMACHPEIELRIVDGKGRSKKFKQRQFKEHRVAA